MGKRDRELLEMLLKKDKLLKMTSPKLILTFQYLLNPCCLVLQLMHCRYHKESCMYNKVQTLCS